MMARAARKLSCNMISRRVMGHHMSVCDRTFHEVFLLMILGLYSPPVGCNFTTVIFNMSITSARINYDRLGLLYLSDVEVWRTTTGMPVRTGIFYNFLKDVTVFNALLRAEQKVIMQLDNIYNDVFTGNFNFTVTALYYDDDGIFTPAHTILPISAKKSSENKTSVISLPDGNASVPVTFPRNVERAVVSIIASGNGAEEFWFTNVPTEYEKTFDNTAIYGYSPFREFSGSCRSCNCGGMGEIPVCRQFYPESGVQTRMCGNDWSNFKPGRRYH